MINPSLYTNKVKNSVNWYDYFDKIYYIFNDLETEDINEKFLKEIGILKNNNKFSLVPNRLDKKASEIKNFRNYTIIEIIRNAYIYNYERILILPNSIKFISSEYIENILKETLDNDITYLNKDDIDENCISLNKKAIDYIIDLNLKFTSKDWFKKLNYSINNYLKIGSSSLPLCLHKIDFVLTYVNSEDEEWQEDYKFYSKVGNINRFRDYGTLPYLLRSVEKYLPWIDNFYLIVSNESQVPEWINKDKIKIVYHKDIIPNIYLPTYNSCTIEMFIPFIKNLSEYYIYSNDDIFLFNKMSKDMFFTKGKSVNCFTIIPKERKMFNEVCVNNFKLCMKDFSDDYMKNFKKFDSKYKKMFHTLHAFFKSTGLHLHKLYSKDINLSISRFRNFINYNQYIYGIYDYISFNSININEEYKFLYMSLSQIENINLNNINEYTICINDNSVSNFDYYVKYLNNLLLDKFNKKSSYELKNTTKKVNLDFDRNGNKFLKVALCAIAKNENLYIREWVEWYKNLGITKIFIYDNNDIDGERFEDVINDYIENKFVEILNWRGITKTVKSDKDGQTIQGLAYSDCYYQNYENYDYICFFDIDEYLEIYDKYKNLNDFLTDFIEYDGVRVQWKMYGDNGNIFYENKPLFKRFKDENNVSYDKHLKQILKCKEYEDELIFCAHGVFGKKYNFVNVLKEKSNNVYMDVEPYENLPVYLNHFYSKSLEEFLLRKYNKTSAVTGVNYSRNFNIDFLKNQYFEHNKRTEEKENYINIFTNSNNSVNVYMASLYKDGNVIKSIKSIISQPQVKSLTLSANNYTNKQYENLIKEINSDKLIIYRTRNKKKSFEKLRYVNCDKTTKYVAFCDDDLIYYKGYFSKMIYMCEKKNSPVSYHGSILKTFPINNYYSDRKSFSFNREVKEDKNVDIIGNGVSLFKREWLSEKEWNSLYKDSPSIPMDDIIISYFLRKNNKKLYVIKHYHNEVIENENNENLDTIYKKYKSNDSFQTEWINKNFVNI